MRVLAASLMLRKVIFTAFLTLSFGTGLFLQAQITSSSASFTGTTAYPVATPQDPVFVFCDTENSNTVGELTVESPDGTGGWNFTWTQYDETAKTFSIPVKVNNDASNSDGSPLSSGGYQVVIEKDLVSDTLRAWVFNNNNSASISLKEQDCEGVAFETSFTQNTFTYFDVSDGTPITFQSSADLGFALKRENTAVSEFTLSDYNGETLTLLDDDAFEDFKSYTITVTDRYGCTWESSPVEAETYVPKAGFTVKPTEGEAPLEIEVAFENNEEPVNATEFEWFFYNDFSRIEENALSVEDSLLVSVINLEIPDPFIYEHPGEYFIKLVVAKPIEDAEVCTDTLILETPIIVDTSLVEVPNVFTPNGDGINDIFRVKSQSLKKFHATIYNRWGRELFEWKNPDEGWNGKVNGRLATPGTYFYVITAVGREFEKKTFSKKGSFMLIRGK